jgi:hypothetical protein
MAASRWRLATSTGSMIARDGIRAARNMDMNTDAGTDTGARTGDGRIRAAVTTTTHHPRITIALSPGHIATAITGELTPMLHEGGHLKTSFHQFDQRVMGRFEPRWQVTFVPIHFQEKSGVVY